MLNRYTPVNTSSCLTVNNSKTTKITTRKHLISSFFRSWRDHVPLRTVGMARLCKVFFTSQRQSIKIVGVGSLKAKINVSHAVYVYHSLEVISLFFISGYIMCQANYSSLAKREKWLCVTWLKLECNHSNRMWCRAVHLCICVQERGCSALGVVGLTHTCMRVAQWESALLTQPCMVESKRNLDWYAVSFQCHLCVCYCGICTSSITDTHGLSVLKAKSQYKLHLVSKQSGTQTQHIFGFVDRIC